jgi:hypothetical protein
MKECHYFLGIFFAYATFAALNFATIWRRKILKSVPEMSHYPSFQIKLNCGLSFNKK